MVISHITKLCDAMVNVPCSARKMQSKFSQISEKIRHVYKEKTRFLREQRRVSQCTTALLPRREDEALGNVFLNI